MAAFAESLPFADESFDAAMPLATIDDYPFAGLCEMRRVARRAACGAWPAGSGDQDPAGATSRSAARSFSASISASAAVRLVSCGTILAAPPTRIRHGT